ncbi:hypothetical protein FF021_13155, partial [Leptospira noguchii]
FGISATIAFAFVMPNSRYLILRSKYGLVIIGSVVLSSFIDPFRTGLYRTFVDLRFVTTFTVLNFLGITKIFFIIV